jgi:hypothetical protein
MCFLYSISNAQDTSLIVLSPKQMQEDVLFFYEKIEEIHPNPYCILDKEQYFLKKQELLNSIDTSVNQVEFWIKIGQLASIYDAHTGILPPLNSLITFLEENRSLFFFNGMLKMKNKIPYFGNLYGVPDSLKGMRILSINGVSADTIVDNLAKFVSQESVMNIDKRLCDLFFIYYPISYNYPQELWVKYCNINLKVVKTINSK